MVSVALLLSTDAVTLAEARYMPEYSPESGPQIRAEGSSRDSAQAPKSPSIVKLMRPSEYLLPKCL